MRFEWDEKKNAKNKRKHGVSFKNAKRVFFDPKRFEEFDRKHSFFEERWITVGFSDLIWLTVVFTERNGYVRIISARNANKKEEEAYFYGYC
ncbi:MAG: BrnT family toxin [Treponema sp.]|nr:BrnT family toxin [Treponema sp.]